MDGAVQKRAAGRPGLVPEGAPAGAGPQRRTPAPALRRRSRWRVAFTMTIYQVVYLLVFLCYGPVLLWRMARWPGYREGFRERMGHVPRTTSTRPVIWIHGVSVGEIKAAGTLIEQLAADYAHAELVISSTTPAGHALARRLHPDRRVIFYPLDFARFPRRALDRIAPACVLLVELEIWPNFLQGAADRGIPVAVVNGRISERSFRGYRRVRGFLPQFDLIDLYCVQDDSYRKRLEALGVDPARIVVTGNTKYDGVLLKARGADTRDLRSWLAPEPERRVLVAGSTHADEEVVLARVTAEVGARLGQPLRLVVAPRHPPRAGAVREALEKTGARARLWSTCHAQPAPLAADEILIVDTIGQLEMFYGACDVAFVGGSLVPHGGQNMLEPAALGKAVVFGPHTGNFRADVQLLLNGAAAIQVVNADDLRERLLELCADPQRRAELGRRAVAVIGANQGATVRTLRRLEPLLRRALAARPAVVTPAGG